MTRMYAAALALLGVLVSAIPVAHAGDWDLTLGRLCSIGTASGDVLDCGGGYSPSKYGNVERVFPHNGAFRSLMSELGVVFAPNILSPADTRGYSGFATAVQFGWTHVNPRRTTSAFKLSSGNPAFDGVEVPNLWYWRAARSVNYKAFETGDITSPGGDAQIARERIRDELPSSFAPTVTVLARKGLWLPVPSFEVGVGVRHLIGSRMWAPLVQAKVALAEGFQGFPFPALAVRGSGARVIGTPDFNLTVAGLDFSASKHFGIGSTWNLAPYAGYQLLWIIADSEVLDATPSVDAMQQTADLVGRDPIEMTRCRVADCNANFSFADQSNITRHRAFFGVKANFYIASLLVEYSYIASGSKSDEVVDRTGITVLEIPDDAGTQHSISFAVQLDY
jgi:hypothetical protein